jgi:hypothetical protein
MVRIAVVNSSAVINFPQLLPGSDQKMTHAQERGLYLQFDLSGKAVYLRPYEYWSHLTHLIKNLAISISTGAEYPKLCNKILSTTPVNYPSPSSKDGPDFSPDLPLQFRNCPPNQDPCS